MPTEVVEQMVMQKRRRGSSSLGRGAEFAWGAGLAGDEGSATGLEALSETRVGLVMRGRGTGTLKEGGSVERLQVLPGLEADRLSGRDGDFGAGPGIAGRCRFCAA